MRFQTDSLIPRHLGSSDAQLWLSIAILTFGVLITAAVITVNVKREKGWGPMSSQLVGMTVVVTAGVFLFTAGLRQEQTAPMIGLLGTITGFLFGRGSKGGAE